MSPKTPSTPRKTPGPAAGEGFSAGPRSRALFEADHRYLAPGLQTIATHSGLAMESGSGSILRDVDGNEYLDFVAGVCVASVGHSHPEYVKALTDQLSRLTVGSFTSARRASFVKNLSQVTPKGLDRVQLYSSGAEAVEAALRLAKSRTKKFEVLGFWGGFHGKTGGVLGLLGDSFKHSLGPLMPGLHLSPYPDAYRCPLGAREEHDCAAHCLEFLRTTIRRSTAGMISAILVEPVQGTAGNIIPPRGFLQGLKDIARENGALLIADEMITGFGRTGRMFGCDHEGVIPDVMTVGKGMGGGFPVSGIITTTELAQSKPFGNPSGSSSSYGGNPLASAACDAALRIVREDCLVANSRKIGEALLKRLSSLAERFRWVGHVSGRGLMIRIELVADKASREPLPKDICREMFDESLKSGLLTMGYNPSVRINPPLCLTLAEAMRGADILERSLAKVAKRHGAS